MKLYTTPPSILTLVTWVQRTQAWPSANSARRLAFGQTESYSVQPRLPLTATIGLSESLFLLSPARILDGRARLYSSELSYSYYMGPTTTKRGEASSQCYRESQRPEPDLTSDSHPSLAGHFCEGSSSQLNVGSKSDDKAYSLTPQHLKSDSRHPDL